MIDVRIKYNGVKVRLRGFGFKKFQNLRILEAGLKSIKARLARGIGSDDGPTKPLSKRYAIRKSRLTKRRAIRDLRLTGVFLDGLLPRYADDHAAVAYSGGKSRGQGPANVRLKQRLYHQDIKFSDNDQKPMRELAAKFFAQQVSEVTSGFSPGPRARADKSALFRRKYFGRAA